MITQERTLQDFEAIESNIGADLYITIGSPQKVEVNLDDNLVDFIETEVHGKTLDITCRESYSSRRGCKITITVPKLVEIVHSGSGDIEIDGLKNDEFDMDLRGSGDFWINGQTQLLTISLSGSGDGVLEGETDELDVKISGSGSIDGSDLAARSARARVSGSGNIKVKATDDLDASVSGSGNILYYGRPERIDTNVSGSGSIRRR